LPRPCCEAARIVPRSKACVGPGTLDTRRPGALRQPVCLRRAREQEHHRGPGGCLFFYCRARNLQQRTSHSVTSPCGSPGPPEPAERQGDAVLAGGVSTHVPPDGGCLHREGHPVSRWTLPRGRRRGRGDYHSQQRENGGAKNVPSHAQTKSPPRAGFALEEQAYRDGCRRR
jgi:hypothetical protein